MPLHERLLSSVHEILAWIYDPRVRRLCALAAIGELGPHYRELATDFREFGILHLLVLSGSQVQFYAQALKRVVLGSLPHRLDPRVRRWIFEGVYFWGLVEFGRAAGWPAPLTRAILMEAVLRVFPRLAWSALFPVTLLVQCMLFPAHLRSLGLYLSWFACLALQWSRRESWSLWLRSLFVTLLSQSLIIFLLGQALPSLRLWLLIFSANFLLGWLFERALMPTLGWILALSLVLALTQGTWLREGVAWVTPLLGWASGGAGTLVLVAIRAFRYIEGA